MDDARRQMLEERRRGRRRLRVALADVPRQSLLDMNVDPDIPTGEFPVAPIMPAPTPLPMEPDSHEEGAHAEAAEALEELDGSVPDLAPQSEPADTPITAIEEVPDADDKETSTPPEPSRALPDHEHHLDDEGVDEELDVDDLQAAGIDEDAIERVLSGEQEVPEELSSAELEQAIDPPADVADAASEEDDEVDLQDAVASSELQPPSESQEVEDEPSQELIIEHLGPDDDSDDGIVASPAPGVEDEGISAGAAAESDFLSPFDESADDFSGGATAQVPPSSRERISAPPVANGDVIVASTVSVSGGAAPSRQVPSGDTTSADVPSADVPSADVPSADVPSVEVELEFTDERGVPIEELGIGEDTVEIGLPALSSESTLPGVELEEIQADEAERLLREKERRVRVDTKREKPRSRRDTVKQRVAPPEPPPGRTSAVPPEVPPAPPRKRKRVWFETFFSDDYLRTVRPPTPREVSRECDFIVDQLRLPAGSSILDVGCGLGSHAIELTRRGYLVVGLDLSLPMLSRASDEAQDEGLKINFLHGDMRDMVFDGAFDAVICWGTTYGYFDDEENRKTLQQVFRALKPKGVLLLDVVNRDFVVRQQPNLIWFEGDACVVMEESTFNHFSSRLQVKRTVILDDGRQRESNYSLRLFAAHELGQLLNQSGFRVGALTGHIATPGVFFGVDSPRIVVTAERRETAPGAVAHRPPPPPRTSEPAPPEE